MFTCSLGNQLDRHTVGYLTYSTTLRVRETSDSLALHQEESGMCTMVVRDTEKYNTSFSLQFGIPYTYAMFAYTRKIPEKKRKARVALKVGTFGAILEYGVEETITDQSSLSATMVVGFPVGVTCRLRLTRASQTYRFPFHLSDEILLQPIFYGTVTPLLLWFSVKKLVLEPYQARQRDKERSRKRESNKEKVATAKKEAEASVSLMEERYMRIREEEETKGGLVLVAVLYGQLADSQGELHKSLSAWELPTECPSELEYIDITRAVQCQVEDSRLTLWEGSMSNLPGVWDPAPGEDKQILIRYLYQNSRHQVFCQEEEAVKLPKTGHRLSGTQS